MRNVGDAFVVTVRMDEDSFYRLDALRQRHFPPERNFLGAHLTLFHALTQDQCANLRQHIAQLGWQRLTLEFLPPVPTGRGVAIPVLCSELKRRHALLLAFLGRDGLTRQDQQPLSPHVTVQNKVTPATARQTQEEIQADFTGWVGSGVGIDFWRYAGGPWAAHDSVEFL